MCEEDALCVKVILLIHIDWFVTRNCAMANNAFQVGMKCSICRIHSIISIVPIGSVEAADQDEMICNNSAMNEQSPLEIEMQPL